MKSKLITVAEMPEFIKRAKAVGMSDADRIECVNDFAQEPEQGVSLGGGLRKARYARSGAGKSGGYRIVYFYHDQNIPLFLLTIFGKNEKANLTASERTQLKLICKEISKTMDYEND